MSYTRSYHQQIAVHYSGSVSFPASQNGGSVSYNGTEYEDVTVNIEVDTTPFDSSVSGCNSSVNFLTGAVVATEAVHVASINENAKKIGTTIVEGFFKTIRSEISQQIVELSKKIDSHLIHLYELAKTCSTKQKQMEADYSRLSTRYIKIFEDLNNELSNRIYELNKPAFMFKKESETQELRNSKNDLISTVAVFGSEGSGLRTKISASITKKRAFDTINQAYTFLWKQNKVEKTIVQCMHKDNISAKKYVPFCFLETQSEQNKIDKTIFQPEYLPQINHNELNDSFIKQKWTNQSNENKNNIQQYFNIEVSSAYPSNDQHNSRVKNMIMRVFDINSIKSI